MVFAGEASWRWRMLLPSTDRSYETFWRQAVRWLALGATDPVSIQPAPAAGAGDEVVVRMAVRDAAFTPVLDADVTVRITGPDGRLQELRASAEENDRQDPSLFAARFTPSQPGVYRVSVSVQRGRKETGSATSALLVGGADAEMSDPRLNMALLDRLASGTGGRIIAADRMPDLVGALHAAAPAAAIAVQKDLWHNAWSLVLIIGLLTTEWLLRRRWGLR